MVQDAVSWIRDPGSSILEPRPWIQGRGYSVLDIGFKHFIKLFIFQFELKGVGIGWNIYPWVLSGQLSAATCLAILLDRKSVAVLRGEKLPPLPYPPSIQIEKQTIG
jgi:hypothetical protein